MPTAPSAAPETRATAPSRTKWMHTRACLLLSSGRRLGGSRSRHRARPAVNVVFGNRHGSVRGCADSGNSGCGRWKARKVSAEIGTVVVIEDDPHIADLVDLYLRREGFRVLLADDGEKGLEVFAQEDPCIVILDVGLPGARDGFEVCREIRARSSGARALPHGTRRRGRPDPRAGAGGRRLSGQAVLPAGAGGAGAGHPAADEGGSGAAGRDRRRRPGGGPAPPRGASGRRGRRPHHPRIRPARVPGQQRRAWPSRASSCSTACGAPTGTATTARSTSTWPSCARSSDPISRSPPSGASATGSADRCAAA